MVLHRFRALLTLSVVLLIASAAVAVPVDPTASSGVAAVYGTGSSPYVLSTAGEVYTINNQTWAWEHIAYYDVPISVSDIQDWNLGFIIAASGEWWFRRPGAGETWQVLPALPFSPVSAQKQSLGSVKKAYGQ